MMIKNNILSKILCFLILAAGWGGRVYAQNSAVVEGKIYAIKAAFASAANDSYFTNGGSSLTFVTTASKSGSYWIAERSGDSNFVWRFKSVLDNTKYLDANAGTGLAGQSSSYNKFNLPSCGNVAGLYHLNGLIGGGDTRTNLNIGTWGYTTARRGFGRSGYGGCWGTGESNAGNPAWTTNYEIIECVLVNNSTKIRFVDARGNSRPDGEIFYTQENGTVNKITTANATYAFGDIACPVAKFTATDFDHNLDDVQCDLATNTLTFVISDAEWFTIKNHRRSDGYFSISNNGLNATQQMQWGVTDAMTKTEAEYWCLKADAGNGYRIFNKAYGPDYVLGIEGTGNGSRVRMYHISEADANRTHFDKVASNTSGEFCLMLHSNHGIALHDYGSQLGVWNNGNENQHKGDPGSAFVFTQIPPSTIDACPPYNVYRIEIIENGHSGSSVLYRGSEDGFTGQFSIQTNRYLVVKSEVSLDDVKAALDIPGYQSIETTLTATASATSPNILRIRCLSAWQDPYIIRYSPAPTAWTWDANTRWYTIRNNRSNQNEQYNRTYLTTSTNYVTDESNLRMLAKIMPNEQGSYWCFVGDPTNGFVIQNAAYGPHFVLGINGNIVRMVPKDDIPNGFTTVFTAQENQVRDGYSMAYAFRLGLTGNTHIHVTNGGFTSYDHTAITSGDTGSAFLLTAASTASVMALPGYDVYKVTTTGNAVVNYIGPRATYSQRNVSPYFLLAKGAPEVAQAHIGTSRDIEGFSTDYTQSASYLKLITVDLALPIILHRQSYLFNKLNSTPDSQLPGDGFIQKGEGMTTNPFTGEPIQYTSNYTITQYIKHGQGKPLYMPTIDGNNCEVTNYQRWYDYEHETAPNTSVINIQGTYRSQAALYKNGVVVGNYNSRGGIITNATANLPTALKEYWLAVDQSRYNDGINQANGDLTEPSITMRVIYHLVDATVMADSMNACTLGSENWIEEHNIAFPNKKLWNGSNDTKSGVDYIGLNHEFSNYWCYNGQGTEESHLEQMTGTGQLIAVLDPSSTAAIRNVKILANGDAGIGNVQGFARNRFIAFQYPDSKVVDVNSFAIINVYMQNAQGTRFQLARIRLTFIGNAEPLLISEVYGRNADGTFKSQRSKEAMEATYGKAISELTFDHQTEIAFNCPTPQSGKPTTNAEAYAFPLDFKQSSYAYHGAPWASRGEYIFRNGGSGIGGKTFYPIDSYKDALESGSNIAKKTGKYFLYVDASEQPGQVMSIPIPERLCVGSKMFCYGWFNSATQISQQSVGIVINIVGKRKASDETGEIIYSYNPGLLSTWAFDSDNNPVATVCGAAPWRQVGFSFNIDAKMAGRYEAYEMQVMNNCYSTNGGDYTLDNFYIYVNPPKGNVDFTTPLCSDALRHVKVHTDYDMLIEASGVNTTIPDATIPVSFCFLNKEIYDEQTKDYYDVDAEGKRTLKDGYDYDSPALKAIFNQAFGDALIGERTIEKSVKGHGFHNFTVPVDYASIPKYAYNDSPDDQIFKEEKGNGERRIVFKEQLYQSNGSAHNWEPGKSYYLLFAPYHVKDEDVEHHEVGTKIFHIADQCCVLTTFSIMPPIEVKGDATVTSSDQVKACDNQIITFTVDMPALKLDEDNESVSDAVISGLNYDWWIGTSKADATYAGFYGATLGLYASVEDARRYNHKSVDDYPDDADVDRKVYLKSALENIRFYYPEARTLDEVSLTEYDSDNGYGIVAEHLACVAHYLAPIADGVNKGRKPLSLFGQTFNLKVSHAEADANNKQHFVAIPIVPEQHYGVDEKLIYCPAPQELIIEVGPTAPNMQSGFGNMTYPDHIVNVPVRMGRQQVEGVRKAADADLAGNTLNIPLRKITVTGGSSTELLAKDHDTERFGSIYLTATDDPQYSFDTDGGSFIMRRVAQVIDIHATKTGAAGDAYMKIAFTHDFPIHEGYTYTLKLPYVEDEECECEGTLVFDLKIVPEYQVWTGSENADWSNDRNWARADRSDLHAGVAATGQGITGATSLTDAASYASNQANTTSASFVPMYFTNVLLQPSAEAASLYKDGSFNHPTAGSNFLEGLEATATTDIAYDLSVTPVDAANRTGLNYNCNYTCELFDTYQANGLTFEAGAQLGNAHFLTYRKAWVEYELDANRWYTIASPLKRSFAGDWYSPTKGGKQLTPHFYDINYSTALNDRFRPAYYQRSWDRDGNNLIYEKSGNTFDSFVKADWSYVYNDAAVNYSTGGFSVKAELDYMAAGDRPADQKVLVRLPKADTSYTYYDVNGGTGQANPAQVGSRTESSHLLSDDLQADGSGAIAITVSNQTPDNNFLLVANPFMAAMDMDAFFAAHNEDLEPQYWIVDANRQDVSIKANGTWITTGDTDGRYVAPLQGFFVKKKAGATQQNVLNANYTASMQTVVNPTPTVSAPALRTRAAAETSDVIRLVAERDGAMSTALIVLNHGASDNFVAGEDCEAFIDGNLYEHPTVYTSADATAQTINVRQSLQMVPVGMISADDSEATLRFDLSQMSGAALAGDLYLYDKATDTYTEISDGTEVTMSGNNAGRYFLTTTKTERLPETFETRREAGVWTPSGIYCGTTVEGLKPGLYVVDGVRMLVK